MTSEPEAATDVSTIAPPARRVLFRKYFTTLFIAVLVPLLVSGIVEAWFGYRDQRTSLNGLLRVEAESAASKIDSFIDGIHDQMGWVVQLPWGAGRDERHRLDALRLLRQVPAINDIALLDGGGHERLYVSRLSLDRVGKGDDRSEDPAFRGARAAGIWYGPVTYFRNTEPHMSIAVSSNRAAAGVAVAEINLKHVWDVISTIHIGETGRAFVLDGPGRLLAHPDISMVLRGADHPGLRPLQQLRADILASGSDGVIGRGEGGWVMAAMAPIADLNWSLVVELPLTEAFAPIYGALWRTAILLVLGACLAAGLAYVLARRAVGPIAQLGTAAAHIGAGRFDHRIAISTKDEFELLGNAFNRMAMELAASREHAERIARLRRFLAPQVAELVDRVGDDSMLDGQRREIVAVFCDLRGFTAFAAASEPETIMGVLSAYHRAVGAIIVEFGATLTSFSGDGMMVLVNAPVPVADPALHAVRMAARMQDDVQVLITEWRRDGHALGFGVGLAMGVAIVGRIGYEGRLDYTAIGNAVNLGSRLCASAEDGQVLVDEVIAESIGDRMTLMLLEARLLKGYDREFKVFALRRNAEGSVSTAST